MNDFTQTLIAELRSHDGKVTQGPMTGTPLLILTTTGARTGEPRTTVVDYSRDGDSWVVAASKGGAPTNPAWYHNLLAQPRVTIEVDGERFEATARAATGAERDRLWNRHVEAIPLFGDYPARTTRVIPIVVLDRAS